ncbi:MAG TPA: hypothetical protein PKN65_08645 [Tenuifilaceae bacterium]|nr:hypothetical protein [Tenuifilaceae bacterium]
MKHKTLTLLFFILLIGCNNQKESQSDLSNKTDLNSSLPEELTRFSRILTNNEIELYIKKVGGLQDTALIVKRLYPYDDSLQNTFYAILIIRDVYGFPNQNFEHNTNIYFYRNDNNYWHEISSYKGLKTEFDFEFEYKFRVFGAGQGLSFVLKADRDGQSYIFIGNKLKNIFKKIDGTFYYVDKSDFVGIVSSKDTVPWRENNLPMQYKVYEEYYLVNPDSISFDHGIYNSIHDNYLVREWVDFKGRNDKKRISKDSIDINELKEAGFLLNRWK